MQMTKDEATAFFAELFQGEHHIPGKLQEWGEGWRIKVKQKADWDIEDGKLSPKAYFNTGSVTSIYASCSCGHAWNLRGVVQITELE